MTRFMIVGEKFFNKSKKDFFSVFVYCLRKERVRRLCVTLKVIRSMAVVGIMFCDIPFCLVLVWPN